MTTALQPVSLRETAYSAADRVTVDEQAHVIKGVKILGRESPSKKRSYAESALRNGVGLYEGAKVNLNHMAGKAGEFRSILDRIGRTINARYVEGADGGIYGDLSYNPEHPYAKTLVWFAKNDPGAIGLSHDAMGKEAVRLPGGSRVIEEILSVGSVDLVADPATNRGLFEAQEPKEPQMDLTTLTAAQLKEARPDLIASLTAESEQVKAVTSEIKQLKEAAATAIAELDKYKAREALELRKAARLKLLEGVNLPAELVTDVFKASLVEAKDEDTAKAIIEDRRKLLEATTSKAPKSREAGAAGAGNLPSNAKEFAKAFKS